MKEEIIKWIESYQKIIIHRHVRPDPDALGSQLGLAHMLKNHYPEKEVYVVGEEEPSLQWLGKMDQIDDDMFTGALVIVCDTANMERISDQRYMKGEKVIKIDHHPNDEPYGDLLWIDTTASSVSEMIYELYETWGQLKGMKLPVEAASCIYAGIVGDTGRFLYPNTTVKTFKYASELVQYPISIVDIYEKLGKKTVREARLEGYILNHFQLLENGVGTIKLTKELLMKYDVAPSEASRLVNSFSSVDGLVAWVIFVEEPEQIIRVRLRSKGPAINRLASEFNGGGHPLASGATVYSWNEADQVLQKLIELCKQS